MKRCNKYDTWASRLIAAIFSLILSALILIAIFLYRFQLGVQDSIVKPLVCSASDSHVEEGYGSLDEKGGLLIKGLSDRGRAIVKLNIGNIAAANYPFLRVSSENLWAGTAMRVFWRNQEEPNTVYSYPIHWSGNNSFVSLRSSEKWDGAITELGLLLTGRLKKPVELHKVELLPFSAIAILKTLWSQWTAFEGWHGYSINFIVGGVRNPLVAPVPAAAAWVGLSFLLYGLFAATRQNFDWRVATMILMVGWLALDIRWQLDLWRQVSKTYSRFADKTLEEKRLAAEDGVLFKLINDIKKHMPRSTQRIFLLTKDPKNRTKYIRLRAQYHLLPHNVYSFNSLPPHPKYLRGGDFVLDLGNVSGITFDAEQGILHWSKFNIEASREYQAAGGSLYRIISLESNRYK